MGPRVRGAESIAEFKMGSIVVPVEMLVCIQCKHVLSDSSACSTYLGTYVVLVAFLFIFVLLLFSHVFYDGLLYFGSIILNVMIAVQGPPFHEYRKSDNKPTRCNYGVGSSL